MKNTFTFAFILLLGIFLFGSVQLAAHQAQGTETDSQETPAFTPNDEREISEVLNGYGKAIVNQDWSGIEEFVLATDEFSHFEGNIVNSGWSDFRDHHLIPEVSAKARRGLIAYFYEDIQVVAGKTVAFATFTWHVSSTNKDGVHSAKSNVGTAGLIKTDAKWKIIHHHLSADVY